MLILKVIVSITYVLAYGGVCAWAGINYKLWWEGLAITFGGALLASPLYYLLWVKKWNILKH